MTDKVSSSEVRSKIAEQILQNRKWDREGDMTIDRSGGDYEGMVYGMAKLFDYARTFPDAVVYDIGAGNTRGISEIAGTDLGKGLKFKATSLTRGADVDKFLGNKNLIITPVETLRRIPDGSAAVVLGVNSVAYSTSPKMAVASIDRILRPGGVFKGTFLDPYVSAPNLNMKEFDEFRRYFEERGYDISTTKNINAGTVVVVVVKPGGKETNSESFAYDLLQGDKKLYESLEPQRGAKVGMLMVKEDFEDKGLDLNPEEIRDHLQYYLVEGLGYPEGSIDLVLKELRERR